MNVYISTSSFGEYDKTPLDLLEKHGIRYTLNPRGRALTVAECMSDYPGMDGLVAGTEKLGGELFERCPQLKVISRVGAGTDNVDRAAAEARGIQLFATPDAPSLAVAELTMGLLLDTARGIARADRLMRMGKWKKEMGSGVRGKTLGIVGLGRIGKRVASLARAFGMACLAFDLQPDLDFCREQGIEVLPLDELLSRADYVSVHLPAVPQNHNLIAAPQLARMKSHAVLINTSRGELVDEAALLEALQAGRIRGAALDVFKEEPYRGPLLELDNVVLTPHIGSYSKETRIEMETQAVVHLLQGFGISPDAH